MNDTAEIAIDVRDAVKRYGDFTALQKISLGIRDNEFFTLLGPSGCGKTTLLRMIAGFEDVTEGGIFLFGDEIETLPPHKRPVNTVFQNYALFPHMTILENVGFGLEMKGSSRKDAAKRADEMLELVHLSQFAKRKPAQLSGGQQQRVALARALAPSPKVLLLDEPLSALDLKLRKAMQIELKHIQRETGITFIFVTHDQEEAMTVASRVAVMVDGTLSQVATPDQIYEAPNSTYVADFIGDANIFSGTIVGQKGENIVQVETAIGTIEFETPTAPTSKKVNLCWRPESAVIGNTGIKAKVVHRAFQGHFTDLMVETNGTIFRVQAKRVEAQEGDDIQLSVAPNAVILLDQSA